MEKDLLTRKDLSIKFSVHIETIRRWEKQGILPVATKIHNKPRYSSTVVEELVKKGIGK